MMHYFLLLVHDTTVATELGCICFSFLAASAIGEGGKAVSIIGKDILAIIIRRRQASLSRRGQEPINHDYPTFSWRDWFFQQHWCGERKNMRA